MIHHTARQHAGARGAAAPGGAERLLWLSLLRTQREQLAAQQRELADRNAALERANRALELARAQAAAIVAASADGIMVVDGEHRIVAVNPALERLSGYSAAELVGSNCTYRLGICLADGLSVCDATCPFRQPPTDEGHAVDARLRTKDGRRVWVSTTYGPIRDDHGHIEAIVHTIRDIDERKRLELAKDEFFSVVNHEIKSPLASAKASVQLVLRQARLSPDDPASAERLQIADRQLSRIAGLVDQLLDVSRAQVGRLTLRPERLDLAALARRVAAQMQVTTDRHALVVQAAGPIPGYWDRARLEGVLINLLGNAVRYSPGGGEIVVGARREGDRAVLWVQDHGIGIPPEAQRRLFEPYFRSPTAQQVAADGLGLGLYISRQIVVAHGGEIQVESREGDGATFRIVLPGAPSDL